MNDELHRLVYLSRNEIQGDENAVSTEINQILRTAQKYNIKQDVTGALMFNADCFAQVLEGQKDQIQNIFDRIEKDQRHSSVVTLDFSPVQSRIFPEWSMGYVGEDDSFDARFFMIAEETNFDLSSLPDDKVFDALLKGLSEAKDLPEKKNAA